MICVNSVTINKSYVKVGLGRWCEDLKAEVCPLNATNKTIEWCSEDTSIASVNPTNGRVYGMSEGTTYIHANATDGSGVYDTVMVRVVEEVFIDKITLSETSLLMQPGDTKAVLPTITPSSATNKILNWSSSDYTVARFNALGEVEAVSVGTAIIKAKAQDDGKAEASCAVTVTDKMLVRSITVDPECVTINQENQCELKAKIHPSNAENQSIKWRSLDETIAFVHYDKGLLTGIAPGETIILAEAQDGTGVRGLCNVKVLGPKQIESIELNKRSIHLMVGGEAELIAEVSPDVEQNRWLSWESGNSDVALVVGSRLKATVIGVNVGKTDIWVKAKDGSGVKTSCSIIVEETKTKPTEEKQQSSTPGSTVADPVDVFNGAHLLKNKVFTLFGAQNLALELQYNSVNLVDGCFGTGWYHNYEKHLEEKECEIWAYSNPASYLKFTSNDGITYNCTTAGKTGYVLTVDRTSNTPYCLNCNNEIEEYYNSNGLLSKVVAHNGFETFIDHQEYVDVITDALTGRSIYLFKNSEGKIESVYEEEHLRQAFFTYEYGNLVTITDPNGKTLSFTYDEMGRVLTGTDAKGTIYFENAYDDYGRVMRQKDGNNSPYTEFDYGENGERTITNRNGDVSTRIFDSNGMLISHTDEDGNTKTYEYDANFNMIKETDALGNSIKKVYNSFNKPTEIIDKNGNKTTLEYDSKGNLLKICYPMVNGVIPSEQFAYSDKNQLISHTDLRGIVTVYTYDDNGLPKSKKVGGKNASLYVYENGLLKSETDPLGHKVEYTYDEYGMLTSKTDALGNTTNYLHDWVGNLLKTTDALGKTTVTVYDGNYQKEYAIDANGNTTQYGYDGNMKNTAVTLPNGSSITYIYDNEDRLVQVIDGASNITLNEYYKSGKVKAKQAADSGKFSFEYDAAGNVIKETNPKGAEILKTYDAAGNVLTVTDNDGNLTRNQYDSMSRLIRSVNAVSGTTVYEYSLAGDLLCVTDSEGNKKRFTYDDFGNKLTETDANGNTTVYSYDANNNLLSVTDALGGTTTYTYDSQNQLKTVRNAKGAVITYGYDALGRRTSITDAKGNIFTTVYDAMGNVIRTLDAKGNTITETTYNSLNLPHIVTDAQGKTITYTYNSIGKVDTITNSDNKVKRYLYDSVGRNRQVTDEMSGISTAIFDTLGNITALSGPLGSTVNYIYDDKGRLTSESTSSGGSITYGYNELNVKEQLTNARGQKRKYFYDALGRVTGYVGAEDSVSYTYDAVGNVLTVTDKNGTIKRTYDALNRVSTYTDTFGKTINYIYDSVGNLQTLIYPDNTAVNYSYDVNNNLETVTDWSGRVTRYSYDKNNRVTGVIKPDGSITTTVYDNKQRVTRSVETTASGTVITGFEYTYDTLSRIVEEKHLAENRKMCYTYDELGRVKLSTIKDLNGNVISEETFNYDAAGNITAANTESMSYDNNNRLTEYLGHAVEYDADGNMLSNGLLSFEYDSANRLLKAGDNAYIYNAEDVRIRNLCGDFETTYTYNTNCKLSQLLCKTTNGITTKYVYGLGLIGQEKQNEFKTYHFDYRGSTVAITNINGTIIDTFKYDTYGKMVEHIGSSFVIFGYNGRDGVITDNNGLIYMRARYYSPDMRRFVNADILHGEISDSTSLNRYSYVNGNPVSFIDPFGLAPDERRTINYKIDYRNDINGIGLMPDGTILFGMNAKSGDVYALMIISEMTKSGISSSEILNFVNDYVDNMNGDTVIKKDKLLNYYTNFEDITSKLSQYMLRNETLYTMYYLNGEYKSIADLPFSWIANLSEFKTNVQNKGVWDLKQKSEWQSSSLYYFNGEIVDADAPGNIMYGYMGKAYGIPDTVLYYAAGYAQYVAGNSKQQWFYIGTGDDPIDTINIERGIEYYNSLH